MILALAVSIGVGLIIASAVTATCLGEFLMTAWTAIGTGVDHLILLNCGIELIEVEHCKKKKKIVENENTRGEIEAKQSSINIPFI